MARPTKEDKMLHTTIRLSPEEKAYYTELAWQRRVSLSTLLREALQKSLGAVPEDFQASESH
jgi:predicted transcriptional regulator